MSIISGFSEYFFFSLTTSTYYLNFVTSHQQLSTPKNLWTFTFTPYPVSLGLEGTVYLSNVIYKTRLIWLNGKRFKNWSFPFTGSVCKAFARLVKFGLPFIYVQSFVPLALHFQNRYSRRYWPGQYLPKYMYNCWIFVLLEGINDLHLSMMSVYCVCYVSTLAVSLFITMTYYTGCIT